jgi:hypothetical protein
MARTIRITSVLALVTVLLFLLTTTIPMVGAAAEGSRALGTITVPQWKVGDTWGYQTGSYGYYYGVGFEVVGKETVNGYECYKVKIWWDASYGTETNYEMDFEMPGFSNTYKYVGYAYFTTEKLAIAKFTNELEMRTKYDGSELYSGLGVRGQDEFNIDDYADLLETMKNWKSDIYCMFKITYDYNPPFVMYDYPLEVNKKWTSTSTVSVNWNYETSVFMNDAMKDYAKEMGGTDLTGIDATNEEGSDSTEFSLTGSFEVLREDTVTTDTTTYDVFVIDYDILTSFTRAAGTEPPTYYSDVSVPGGEATLTIAGGNDGSGTSYFDPAAGYPQKIDTDGYYTDDYSTVEPDTIENSYSDLAKPSSFAGGDKDDDGGVNTLLLVAGIIGIVMVIIIVVLVVLIKKMGKRGDQQYPPQGSSQYQQPPQQQYPQYPPQQQPQQPPQYPQQQYPPQPPQQPPAYPPPQY